MSEYSEKCNSLRGVILRLVIHTHKIWPDKLYLQLKHWGYTGKWLDFNNPKSFSEKCQWMKLYCQRPIFTKMVDKYEVKQIVSDIIGAEHVVECYGVWDNFDDIDFDALPNQFVLKCTHDSGGYVICKDKSTFNKEEARKILNECLKHTYGEAHREWVYKNVKHRILAERYMDSLGKPDSIEYKITCMGGEVKFVTICTGIPHSTYDVRFNDHFTKDWERMDWYARYKPTGIDYKKTPEIEKMMEFSEKISKDIPQVRVDWYVHEGQIYFGECTFYTWAGWPFFTPEEWDYKLGEWFILPDEKVIEKK